MKIIRANDYADMSRKAANILSAQIILKPDCVLGLATGGTPVGAYQQLVEWYNKGDLDFSGVTTVNLDEYRGLPKDHPESYWSFMHRNLFDHVNIDPAHIHLPDGTNPDADDACAQYNQIIHSVGGIDLQLLGLGPNGHIGFNEPGKAFELETHCVDLTEATIEANKRFFDGNEDLVPRQAYTMASRPSCRPARCWWSPTAWPRQRPSKQSCPARSRRNAPAPSCSCIRTARWWQMKRP